MKEPANSVNLEAAFITDRGLNEKRPLNEDSFLSDPARRIFAVADGVGGAEAGEVASKTAVEVLDEAFRHQVDGADIEDLMELAIQRANSSIHQMAREHPKLSMMATTIVALHLDGHRATIGHVGDSRLYRLTPDGKLHRETADHSIVEEEVRAGRMTPEQAANHPSKNVISRALGAEPAVEVDLKIIEVDDGTAFLLCTDGITRHLPDGEIRELLNANQEAGEVCAEMKRRCYERGAEDNLTAVIVRVGPRAAAVAEDHERTLSLDRPVVAAAGETKLTPASRIAFPGPATQAEQLRAAAASHESKPKGKGGGVRFFLFLLFVGAVAGAFYGGTYYQKRLAQEQINLAPVPAPTLAEINPRAQFEVKRGAVDSNPQKWIDDNLQNEVTKEGVSTPADLKDPEFLCLYGRALMLVGKHREAVAAFDSAVIHLQAEPNKKLWLDAETRMAAAAASLRLKNKDTTLSPQEAKLAEEKAMRVLEEAINLKAESPAP
ncbi:MAG TPA: PP2C family serine/threonine-protein phosphatase [Pyrinomonadaceae bacterium]|jgi:protein phosphatase